MSDRDAYVGTPGVTRRPVVTFTLALVVPIAAILLHELGHFTANSAFGYEINRLTFASVVSGDPPPGVDPEFARNLSLAAGASVSLALVAGALASVALVGPSLIALALAGAESLRAVSTAVRQVARFGADHTLTAGFGELRYANRALGGPAVADILISWVELGLPVVAFYLIWRRLPRTARGSTTAAAVGGIVAGVCLWMFVLGPAVLPR